MKILILLGDERRTSLYTRERSATLRRSSNESMLRTASLSGYDSNRMLGTVERGDFGQFQSLSYFFYVLQW